MSQIARCCVCDQRVRIPDVDAAVWVRCPHCHEEYELRRVAHDLPPRLEVLGDSPVVIDSEIGAGQTTVDPHDFPETAPQVVIDASGEGDHKPKARVKSPSTLHARRAKKRPPHTFIAIAKVVLGGIAGLAIGQVILWWLPKPYQTDLFELSANVPAAASVILPPNLRPRPHDIEKPVAEPTPAAADDAVASPVSLPESPSAPVPATDLRHSLLWAQAEDKAFDEQEVMEQRNLETWYDGLQQLAYCATNVRSIDHVNRDVVAKLTKFISEIARSPKKRDALAALGAKQFAEDPRDQDGILLVGQVTAIRPRGNLFQTSLQLSGSGQIVEVISHRDPLQRKLFAVDDRLLILGVVMAAQPDVSDGEMPQTVVMGGFPVPIKE